MGDKKARLAIDDLTQGRNGYDAPWAIGERQCVDAVNVDFYKSKLGHKRGGCASAAVTFSAGGPFTGIISTAIRHVPGTDETLAELWLYDGGVWGRMAGGTTLSVPTFKDAATGNAWDVTSASINGKLFLAYNSAQGRLHCWDTSTVRRSGLGPMTAPTVANSAAGGTYAAVLRYYRNRATVQSGGVTIRRSEPSASTSFTPSGAKTAATVTQGTVPSEGETHWEVEASTDNVTFYRIATVAIATTTYDDSALVTTYNTNPLSALSGTYAVQASYKFIAADQNRILGFGDYASTSKQSRIVISAVIGSLNVGDEERVDTTTNYYIDLDEADSGFATGLAGPIFGSFFAFKNRQTWQLTPTGQTSQPYRTEAVSKTIGALTQRCIVRGEDNDGNPCLYWMSHVGPYRWGANGLEYLGRGVEDLVLGPTSVINWSSSLTRAAHTVYYGDKRQVWFWFAVTGSSDPNTLIVYDVRSGGWSRYTGRIATQRCSCMFANTTGASMSTDLKPYGGQTDTANVLFKADTGVSDAGTTFQAYVTTRPIEPGGAGFYGEVGDAELLAAAATGVTITTTVTADFGKQTATGVALLTPEGAETRVSKRLEGSALAGDVGFVQHQIGDSVASTAAWTLDRLVIPYGKRGPTTQ